MLDIAYVYMSVGNQQRFEDAMQRARFGLETLRELGVSNSFMPFLQAIYLTLEGDQGSAIESLGLAVDRGLTMGVKFARAWAALKPLEGTPEFEAVQQRMIDHLNSEREQLGLEPILT